MRSPAGSEPPALQPSDAVPLGVAPEADPSAPHRFEELFRTQSNAILGYALRRVERPEDAADVLAETFTVAWRRIADVPAGDEARLWLYGVARRVLANQRRTVGRQRRLGERLAEVVERHVPPDPGDRVAGVDEVRRAMGALHEADRELLRLTCWEGLTPTEVASVLSLPAVTVRTRLHRARRRLRMLLDTAPTGERGASSGHVPGDGRSPAGGEEATR